MKKMVILALSIFLLAGCSTSALNNDSNGGTSTTMPVDGADGQDGKDGKDGNSPYIGDNGNWWIGDVDTGVNVIPHNKYIKPRDIRLKFFKGEKIELPNTTFAYNRIDEKWDEVVVDWLKHNSVATEVGSFIIEGDIQETLEPVYCYIDVLPYSSKQKTVDGFVNGLIDGTEANVVLFNEECCYRTTTKNGQYSFSNVPNGDYLLRAEASGFYSSGNVDVRVADIDTETEELFTNIVHQHFNLKQIVEYSYYYSWNSNRYYYGNEVSAHINTPNIIELGDYKYELANNSAAITLEETYDVYLSDDGDQSWAYQYSGALLDCYKRIGLNPSKKSVWTIKDTHFNNDVQITYGDVYDTVVVSSDALKYASARSGKLNGVSGTFFSKRLYTVVTRYLTKDGTSTDVVEDILKRNFAVSIMVNDYEELTSGITDEKADAFQQFTPEELLDILEMFEEMPSGYHKIDGFNYIIRRKTGMPHPIYPAAAAVTWPSKGYIEFMSVAFTQPSLFHRYRLIIHEKTHMMWDRVFSEKLKEEWIKIGGWYQEDPNSDTWYTTKTTEFVTAYAHAHNPNEDMAESAAYFILDPDALKARSPAKYQFLEECVFHGSRYVTKVREDLTFEVLNLSPDYDYPGRIKKVEITSNSLPYEDKVYTITLFLHKGDSLKDGASGGRARIYCVNNDYKFFDVGFNKIDNDGYVLQGTLTVNKHCESGLWTTSQIVLFDEAGNERYQGSNDYGFKVYVDNPLEDLNDPEFIANSIHITVTEIPQEDINLGKFSHYLVDVCCDFNDETKEESNIFTRIYPVVHNPDYNVLDMWGRVEKDGKSHNYYTLTDFHPSGEYYLEYLEIIDHGKNYIDLGRWDSKHPLSGEAIMFEVPTRYPDYEGPELDLNNISIDAEPTNPGAPNGETKVTIHARIRDDASGFSHLSLNLVDPQGNLFFHYFYDSSYGQPLKNDDPTGWKDYEIVVILPEGSAPGIWGLYDMCLIDHSANARRYNFVEIVHFEVDS